MRPGLLPRFRLACAACFVVLAALSSGAAAAPNVIVTRAIALSPFGTEGGLAIYFGGYDAAGGVAQNSAWIMRGEWTAVPWLMITRPNPPAFQLVWPATNLDWVLESTPALAPANWQPVARKPTRSIDRTTQSVPASLPSSFLRLRKS